MWRFVSERPKEYVESNEVVGRVDVRDEHTLRLPALSHADPCPLGDRKDMRSILLSPAVPIRVDGSLSVDWEGSVGVDGDEEDACG